MAEAKVNRINLTEKDYEGAPSTMCRGCGHDAISASVMRAYFENSIDPRKVIKLSGIGCSSKTPAYFLSQSFGFNAVHGRMSAVATGTNLANHTLMPIGVSGDGDTSAIGLGNFCHMMRRNVNITYIIENIEADYDEGTDHELELHDGSRIILHKLSKDYDPTNKMQAITAIHAAIAEGKFLTGLIYYNPDRKEFAEELDLCDTALSELTQDDLQPPLEALERINAELMK